MTGRIGSGKSTLLRALLGLIPAQSGEVSWNGVRLDDPASALVPVYDVSASAGAGALVEYEGVVEQLAFPPDYLRRITSTPSISPTITSPGSTRAPLANWIGQR